MESKHSGMKDSELFTVNAKKSEVKKEREKLKKDRFKEKERLTTSKCEEDKINKMIKNKSKMT